MRHDWGCTREEFWDFLQDLHLPCGPLWSQCIPSFPLRLCLSRWPPPWVPDLVPPVSLCTPSSQVLGSGHPFNHAGGSCHQSSPTDQLHASAALSATSSCVPAFSVAASPNHRTLRITTLLCMVCRAVLSTEHSPWELLPERPVQSGLSMDCSPGFSLPVDDFVQLVL